MSRLYPLRFQPVLRRYLWGGRRLGTVLRKPIGAGDDYAESWEVVDHGTDQSVVAYGTLAGATLAQLVDDHGPELFGEHAPLQSFPLLFKFLDAQRTLSVQVHPNDEQARSLDPPDLGKTEAWYVVDAEPGSKIYAGLQAHVDREMLQQHLAQSTCEACLHSFEARPGDCVFIPAGTVHAIGAGLLIAEIQQASDTTFRLFDWNRVDAAGKPRQLHVAESLSTIDFGRGPVGPREPQSTANPHATRLVECDKFVMDRWSFDGRVTIGGDRRFHLLAVIAGEIRIDREPSGHALAMGATSLLPAACGATALTATNTATVLDMYLPE